MDRARKTLKYKKNIALLAKLDWEYEYRLDCWEKQFPGENEKQRVSGEFTHEVSHEDFEREVKNLYKNRKVKFE